jgi:hypothetical protein
VAQGVGPEFKPQYKKGKINGKGKKRKERKGREGEGKGKGRGREGKEKEKEENKCHYLKNVFMPITAIWSSLPFLLLRK